MDVEIAAVRLLGIRCSVCVSAQLDSQKAEPTQQAIHGRNGDFDSMGGNQMKMLLSHLQPYTDGVRTKDTRKHKIKIPCMG